jgi:ankyrin repeat protein
LTGGVPSVSLPELGEMRAAARVAEAAGYAPATNPALATNYAEVNARDRLYGRTALMTAAIAGHVEVARLLVEAGTDQSLTDTEGATAVELARNNGQLEVTALLEQAGGG